MKDNSEELEQFLDEVKDRPDFVCCVCHRLLFRHQVFIVKEMIIVRTL